MLITVSVTLNIFENLTYRYIGDPQRIHVGQRVIVPLMNRFTTAWVTAVDSQYSGRVKQVTGIIDDGFILSPSYVRFALAVSRLYFTSAGIVMDGALSPKHKSLNTLYYMLDGKAVKFLNAAYKDLTQSAKKDAVHFFFKSREEEPPVSQTVSEQTVSGVLSDSEPSRRFLLDYQRMESYLEAVTATLAQGKSVLIAVPDNFSAAYIRDALQQDFAANHAELPVDIYNSEIKPKDREQIWQRAVREGRPCVVTGGISALLLPVPNVGLIITERAGSPLYKGAAYSKFNSNVLARLRAEHEQVPLMEGFSTYTVQAFAQQDTIRTQDKRKHNVQAVVHGIKPAEKGVPAALLELVTHYHGEQKKIALLVNRKQSRDFLYCPKCKKWCNCPSCDGFISIKETDGNLGITCKRCGVEKESYRYCVRCQSELLLIHDISIASVKKQLKAKVVETGILTLSADDLKESDMASLLEQVKKSSVVVGTPAVVNPFWGNLFDAVIYMRPESYVNLDEYDAAERVFSLVSELKELVKPGGSVDVFSTFHFHYSLKLVNDEVAFFQQEIKYRQWFHLPPYFNVYQIEIRGKKLRPLAEQMRKIFHEHKQNLEIKKVYLAGRQAVRGNFKGIIEAHALPDALMASGLLMSRDITIQLLLN